MDRQEQLKEIAESYLKSVFCEAADSLDPDFDPRTPFRELGIDSFHVLKIIKQLEADFGRLPKTLLFENFNIDDLAHHFARKYPAVLAEKFSLAPSAESVAAPAAAPAAAEAESDATERAVGGGASFGVVPEPKAQPIRLLAADLPRYPRLEQVVHELLERHRNEGSVSRGTRNIAPNLFIGADRRGFFNYARCNDIIMVYGYAGPMDYFGAIAQEMCEYCSRHGFQLNILSPTPIRNVGPVAFTATPFGAIQRIENLREFTIEGTAMRRLRYQVNKFSKLGSCSTREYVCGTDPAVDRSIAAVIDKWCAGRTMVNPLIYSVREEILAGRLGPPHRLFLTYTGDVLQNAILISQMSDEQNGYLMDLEFYGPDMPMGGLEYAIVNMIAALVAEGCNVLSLGGTYGVKLQESPNPDPELERILDQLRSQNIFNDEGNLQFKNKFRPVNTGIFLCRPAGSGHADNVIDIIMMIADPAKTQTPDVEHHNAAEVLGEPVAAVVAEPKADVSRALSGETAQSSPPTEARLVEARTSAPEARGSVPEAARPEREAQRSGIEALRPERGMQRPQREAQRPERKKKAADAAARAAADAGRRFEALARAGFNPLNLPDDAVDIDLKTDSWAQLRLPAIDAALARLQGRLQDAADVEESLRGLFPFDHFVLTASGRAAEDVLCRAWPKRGVVPQNLLFPSGIFHQIDKGFTPLECPGPDVFRLDSPQVYKGDIDLAALKRQLDTDAAAVAFVCIELSDNASGGHPVSLQNLQAAKAMLAPHAIPLVLDITRVVENARFIVEREPDYAARDLWTVVRELLACADVATGSLAKDFGINRGGLLATRDAALFERFQAALQAGGGGLDLIDRKRVSVALRDRKRIEAQVIRRMALVRAIWQSLREQAVPVVQPAGGHCVLIDVKAIPELKGYEHPVASFLAWLYQRTGIRAGAHSVGMQKRTAINDLVRLAIPVGLKPEQVELIVERLTQLFGQRTDIPRLVLPGGATAAPGDLHARFELKQATPPDLKAYRHAPQAAAPTAPERAAVPVPAAPGPRPSAPQPKDRQAGGPCAIAVVGMAGRYPKAANLRQLWENLVSGLDCVEEIPPERLEPRRRLGIGTTYRGGFIADVDRFDSLFFNISPREAEMLDPQERLFLEVAWEAIEDAGYYPEILARADAPRDIGVFVGAVWAMYQMLGVEERHLGHVTAPNSFLWSIANRVSYWMNLSGPSLTVDTACSSSLTAIHLACEAIERGECSGAIVGGVNLDLHQSKFNINWAGGALSPDGLCRTFGQGANGYVAGEGIGALYLKPLNRAIEDRDHIYGVIRGVAVNHGGRTSGYTVPSPKAQSTLIVSALKRADVDARTIGYVEAHGTGTELGDPIEISGLSSAFEEYGVARQACPVGSIKTNIGHLEAAAGVVGVSKILLQMKHRTLVPSLHSSVPSELIDFESSPFYVVQQAQPWEAREVNGVRYPLRAGISSFGAGGANAHVIIESHEPPAAGARPARKPRDLVFPLSARTDEELREVAVRLRQFLEHELARGEREAPTDLDSIAFTLQAGRKAFDCRAAIVARTREELIERLGVLIDGGKDDAISTGHAQNAAGLTKLLDRQEKEALVGLLAERREPRKLARLWSEGLLGQWPAWDDDDGVTRVSLPTYPFADRRHWVGSGATDAARTAVQAQPGIHPLLDANESTFERQLFRKTFTEREFFIYDHRVAGIPTLPGVAYLELARKAGELAAGRPVRRIRDILWLSPISVQDAPKAVHVELRPGADGVQFEVFSEAPGAAKVLHSQGRLYYTARDDASAPEQIDLEAIRSRCVKVADGAEIYPVFKALGLNLGPSFQVLKEAWKNDTETLGVLELPRFREPDLESLMLHPSLIDGSLQAGVGAQLWGAGPSSDKSGQMLVPYSLGEVEILHPLQPKCFSYVTAAADRKEGSRVSRGNVLIVDETGRVLVRIRDSIGVPLMQVHKKATGEDTTGYAKLHYAYEWEEAAPFAQDAHPAELPALLLFAPDDRLAEAYRNRLGSAQGDDRRVILVKPGDAFREAGNETFLIDPRKPEDFRQLLQNLDARGCPLERICFAWSAGDVLGASGAYEDSALRQSLERGVYSMLFLSQALLSVRPKQKTDVLFLYHGEDGATQAHNEAVNGFAKALFLENPRIFCKTVEVRGTPGDVEAALDAVLAELHPAAQDSSIVRHEGGRRYLKKLKPCEVGTEPPVSLRGNGVYLITGGAGGLGLIFARFLAKEYRAKLVLTGRSALSPDKEAQLEELRACGAEVLYLRADVADGAQLDTVVAEARSRFGAIHGVIHAAGVLRDAYIRNKTAREMDEVFAPKVFGTLNLDRSTQQEALDFFVTFSSLAAVGGNVGQGDYCFGNYFMDCFAAQRELLCAKGARSGRTLSINWSLWEEGGMQMDEQTRLVFMRSSGISPLSVEVGVTGFLNALATRLSQVAIVEGVQEKVELGLGLRKPPEVQPAPAAPAPSASTTTAAAPVAQSGTQPDDEGLAALVEAELARIVMGFLKLEASDISADKILLDLGFDSIGLATFANAVNDRYGSDITPVLFFDYPTIQQIAQYLCTERRELVTRFHRPAGGTAAPSPTAAPTAPSPVAADTDTSPRIAKGWNPQLLEQPAQAGHSTGGGFSPGLRFVNQPIAIVGMSGVLPMSRDLDEFWDNLKNARDMVTVIPPDRWKWEDYYGDPLREPNKSNSKWGGFIQDVDKFDSLFFGISPREAQSMDPQQRLFLETVWKAIEDSGQKVADLSGTRTGLFVGVATKDYTDMQNALLIELDGYSAQGSSHCILANRISYLLNLHGPSAPIDTACSSSLVALHRAIESIHTGSCDMAIVGGVQVMLTPGGHISFGAAGMMANDGKCKSFDKRANGYVRGEGVGAIFIKPLSMAEADGNTIYAVVKATAENHGGRVTTLTAPNSVAQAELLIEAYEKARIDPTTVGYIECHGTGTSLGDPIEIQGLTKAFAELYKRHGKPPATVPHCGLSTVKTNIGHLETAAGIAGVLKVLLSLKHRYIPANLHFEELNPYINLKQTPFYIVDRTVEWVAPTDERGRQLPRRAGVSSFGFGGANAHVVLEEYIPSPERQPLRLQGPHLIVLSARNEDRLRAYAKRMLSRLEREPVDLTDFAFTLQVGRDEMTERLATVVSSVAEVRERFTQFLNGTGRSLLWFQNNTRERKDGVPAGSDAKTLVAQLLAANDWTRLAELWTCGLAIDWRQLYTAGTPRRISLPTYPFARERHWFDASKGRGAAMAAAPALHPLLHVNTSTFFQQSYASFFSGDELFLKDHQVGGQKVLPGVAYLEMARAGVELAMPPAVPSTILELSEVVWLQPMVVAERKAVTTSVTADDDDRIIYEIRSTEADRQVIHCQGAARFVNTAPVAALDIAELRGRMTRGEVPADMVYGAFAQVGIEYGPAHRGIQSMDRGDREVLARLNLPAPVAETQKHYVLHPSLLDSALQTCLGLMEDSAGTQGKPLLPFALEQLRVCNRDAVPVYAWTRVASGEGARDDTSLLKVDIDLADEQGNVCVQLRGLTSRVLAQAPGASPQQGAEVEHRKRRFDHDMRLVQDHKLDSIPVLIGSVYLSMMVETARDQVPAGDLTIGNVNYLSALAIDKGESAEVVVVGRDDGRRTALSVLTTRSGEAERTTVAKASLEREALPLEGAVASIDELAASAVEQRHGDAFYRHPDADTYGSGLYSVREVFTLEREKKLAARIQLTDAIAAEVRDYAIHPAILDALFVAGIFTLDGQDARLLSKRCLPVAIEKLHVTGDLAKFQERDYFCVIEKTLHNSSLAKMDMQLFSARGELLCLIKGFTVQFVARRESGLQSLVPVWGRARNVVPAGQETSTSTQDVVLLGSDSAQLRWVQASVPDARSVALPSVFSIDEAAAVLGSGSPGHLVWIAPDVDGQGGYEGSIIEDQERGVLAVFRIAKALVQLGYGTKALEWTLVTSRTQRVKETDRLKPAHAGICGFIGSIAKEYPHWRLRVVDVESLDSVSAAECLALGSDAQSNCFAHRAGEWFEQHLAVLEEVPQGEPPCREGGVYVVIGGAGGLGEVWSRYMIERYHAKLVWIGRQECTPAIQRKIDSLAALGHAPTYIAADATNEESLANARAKILETHSAIHGVVHSAIVLNDQSLLNMTEEVFRRSLAAKVDVSVNLDRVFGGLDLDFVLFFSSIVSFARTPGQSNYAAGCTFKDCFAHALRQQRPYPVKIMNWGYWGNVGVVADEAYARVMRKMGIGSIEPREGMSALEALMASAVDQVALLKTLAPEALAAFNAKEVLTCYPKDRASLATERDGVAAAPVPVPDVPPPSPAIDALLVRIIAASLKSLGLFDGGPRTLKGLNLEKPPAAFYERWLAHSTVLLKSRGLLDDQLRFAPDLKPLPQLWGEWEAGKAQWAADPQMQGQAGLLEACLRALPAILSGKQLATDVIFASSMSSVEGVYAGNAVADYFNDVLGQSLRLHVERLRQADPSCEIRILEVGAGTGGTTERLLPLLRELNIAEYCYTDVSKAFLMHAEERYRPRLPALTTAILDITKPLAQQSVATNRYDVVVAANVLHATPDIRQTLRNCKATMKNEGLLLLNEISNWSLFTHSIFGLLEGWWLHEDTALRLPGSPGLLPQMWERVLAEEGFEGIHFPASEAHGLGQQIVAARSDGRVRQRLASKAPAVAPAARPPQAKPAQLPAEAASNDKPSGGAGTSQRSALEHVRRIVTLKLSEAVRLNVDAIHGDTAFADYGVDSIIGVNLVRTVNEALQVELATTSLFEHSTVDQLTQHICATWAEKIAEQLPRTAEAPAARKAPPPPPPAPRQKLATKRRPAQVVAPGDVAAVTASPDVNSERIAIIGMSGRFAQSETLEAFWRNLRDGRHLVSPVSRWEAAECAMSEAGVHESCSVGSFISSIDLFDCEFFRISPLEAKYMDPQQRLFLEESWKALEDAGYAGKNVQEKQWGVYVGCGSSQYDTLFYGETPPHAFWGNSESIIPARVAYFLNLQGPAIAVDTACSSSLVAIHLACQGLWAKETEMALAGGVFLQPTPTFYKVANRARMLSRKGRCYSFDARADGFVPGEAVGVLVLKRLADALRDGDFIHGVIAGSGINQDGTSNGLTAPNARAQERLERAVYERFRIDPETIQVVEAHGTGTLLGDSVEIGALTRSFRQYTQKQNFCALGTLKTNLGHSATAAGVAGVIKLLLALKHRQIPPSLHFEQRSPLFDLEGSPFFVNTELRDWAASGTGPRRAAISSFGFSGTNGHLVIEEAPALPRNDAEAPAYLVMLSARTGEQLDRQLRNLLAHVEQTPDLWMNDVCYTLLVGRAHFPHRFACVVRDSSELVWTLQQWIETGSAPRSYTSANQESEIGRRAALMKFGNHCIQRCLDAADEAEYVESLSTVADLYVQGCALDFHLLFPAQSRRIPLPTYPFARERHWVEVSRQSPFAFATPAGALGTALPKLNPLLHRNTSDPEQIGFSSTFTGREDFIAGCTLRLEEGKDRAVLPAGACVEMVRAAIAIEGPALESGTTVELRDLRWNAPVTVDASAPLFTSLFEDEAGGIRYEIFSVRESSRGRAEEIHCRGETVVTRPASGSAQRDLQSLREQMNGSPVEPARMYELLEKHGMRYGPAQRCIQQIQPGENQLLVRIAVPAGPRDGAFNPPGLIEAVLQAGAFYLLNGTSGSAGPLWPRSIALVNVEAVRDEMFAWIRVVPGAQGRPAFDADLIDANGHLCGRLRSVELATPGRRAPPAGSEPRLERHENESTHNVNA